MTLSPPLPDTVKYCSVHKPSFLFWNTKQLFCSICFSSNKRETVTKVQWKRNCAGDSSVHERTDVQPCLRAVCCDRCYNQSGNLYHSK